MFDSTESVVGTGVAVERAGAVRDEVVPDPARRCGYPSERLRLSGSRPAAPLVLKHHSSTLYASIGMARRMAMGLLVPARVTAAGRSPHHRLLASDQGARERVRGPRR